MRSAWGTEEHDGEWTAPPGMKVPRALDDFAFQVEGKVCGGGGGGKSRLDEECRARTPVPDDYAISHDICACCVYVVFNRPEEQSHQPNQQTTQSATLMYLVSSRSLDWLLIQSSSRPLKKYLPASTSSNRSPLRHPPPGDRRAGTGRSGESGRIQSSRRRKYSVPVIDVGPTGRNLYEMSGSILRRRSPMVDVSSWPDTSTSVHK